MFERAPEDEWRKFGNLRAFYAFMWSHPGKQLLFMGTEFGQRREFSEQRSLDWDESGRWGHRGVQRLVKDLNAVYREHPALFALDSDPAGFRWIDADDRGGNVFSFLRFDGEGQIIACLTNFSTEPRSDYRIGLPAEGIWKEILNTDAEVYEGTGVIGNLGQVVAHPFPSHGFDASANVTIPPLGAVWLLFDPVAVEETADRSAVDAGVRQVAKQASPRVSSSPDPGPTASAAPAEEAPAKTVAKKAPAKKTAAKKTAAKASGPQAAAEQASAEAGAEAPAKQAAKTPAAKEAPAKKTAAKKTAAKKGAAKKTAAKKGAAKKTAPTEEPASPAEVVETVATTVKKAAKKVADRINPPDRP
jgi:1,4-alpha-glucan branching enzyme